MIRLAVRLALAGGRGPALGLALTTTAVAIGTAILLLALAFVPAVRERDARTAWRDFLIEGPGGTLVAIHEDRFGEEPVTRVHLAAGGGTDAPVPPGLQTLPATGTSYLSPALAELVRSTPQDELGDRFGTVVGTIPATLLASPDELLAIVGTEPETLRTLGAIEVAEFGSEVAPLDLPPVAALIAILAAVGALAPVAVFVGTATRMSAARRELRLAALRLVGATPVQVARLAAGEALIATSAGALAGVALFLLARPLVARIPLDGATWWPETIMPPLAAAALLLVAVQVVGIAAAVVAMRRVAVTPLGVQRRASRSAPRARRTVPLAVSTVALLVAVRWYRSEGSEIALGAAGAAFAGIVVGIAVAGPWLTALVGRALGSVRPGAARLLAARRLSDEPHGSFGAIAGVVTGVFVASVFFTFQAYTRDEAGARTDPLLVDGTLVVHMPTASTAADGIAEGVMGLEGVRAVVAVREVDLIAEGGIQGDAWIAPCRSLMSVIGLEADRCDTDGVTATRDVPEGRYELVPTMPVDGPRSWAELTIGRGEGVAPGVMAPPGGAPLPLLVLDPEVIGAAAPSFPTSRLYVGTDGRPEVAERMRTLAAVVAPTASVRSPRMEILGSDTFAELERVVALGLLGTLALAGCSLAVAVTTATLERRRQFVFLRSAGMPASALRKAILLQAAAPLVSVALASAILGASIGAVVLAAGGVEEVSVPGPALPLTLALSLAVALAIVALTLAPLERMTRPASVRHE